MIHLYKLSGNLLFPEVCFEREKRPVKRPLQLKHFSSFCLVVCKTKWWIVEEWMLIKIPAPALSVSGSMGVISACIEKNRYKHPFYIRGTNLRIIVEINEWISQNSSFILFHTGETFVSCRRNKCFIPMEQMFQADGTSVSCWWNKKQNMRTRSKVEI